LRPAAETSPAISSMRHVAVAVLTVLLFMNSCTRHRAGVAVTQPEEESGPAGVLGAQNRALDKLKAAVQEHIASAERTKLDEENRIRSTPPYFYKRFELYPATLGEPEFSIRETDSTLKPYEATVAVRKARFTTKYHTSRYTCARDEEFIRDIGKQTDTHVYESGKWTLMHSLFEVEQTSVLRGDTWADVTRTVDRMGGIERLSFFGRVGAFFRRIF
jgi:hypothetical protein